MITSPAGHLDVTVGESIVLPCQVSHDPTLDLKFTWFFNEQLIRFGSHGDYFEKVGGVSASMSLDHLENRILYVAAWRYAWISLHITVIIVCSRNHTHNFWVEFFKWPFMKYIIFIVFIMAEQWNMFEVPDSLCWQSNISWDKKTQILLYWLDNLHVSTWTWWLRT